MNQVKRSLTLFLAVLFFCLSVTPVYAASPNTISAEVTMGQTESSLDSGELFDEYINRLFFGSAAVSTYQRKARDQLGSAGKHLYDFLKEQLVAIAAGRSSTEFTLTAEQLTGWGIPSSFTRNPSHSDQQSANAALAQFQIDSELENVVNALLHDCPYELYWYDKVNGAKVLGSFSLSSDTAYITTIIFRFTVVQDMQAGNPYTFNPTNVNSAAAAAENAKRIVSTWKNTSYMDKLYAYKDEICARVTYNTDAALSENFSYDADPWQLVYVFDNDSSTNVVCEGYSKAFQYLCDHSDLGENIECITVSGWIPAGAHMWNIVRINGRSYLTDITNSDAGTFGSDGSLFLASATGSILDGYTVKGQPYAYGYSTMDLWGTDSDSYLNISSTKLDACAWGHDMSEWAVVEDATCSTEGSKTRFCQRTGCDHTEIKKIPTKDHNYTSVVTDPTCTEQGYTTHTCSCGDSYKDSYVNALNHSWKNATCTAPKTCKTCGATEGKKLGHSYKDKYDATCDVCGYERQVEAMKTISVYRLYNPYTHEHLLTGGVAEKDLLLSIGWSLDGVAWKAPEEGVPVYRLYNPYDDWHTYTISEAERDAMVAAGWKVDGVVSRGYTGTDGRPIYRLFNPYAKTNFHLFTAGEDERDLLISSGWILEGVAWNAAK